MADLGLIGVGLQMISQIRKLIKSARRFKEELVSLEDRIGRIESILGRFDELELMNRRDGALNVEPWLKQLEELLKQASDIAKTCTKIPKWYHPFVGQTRRKIENWNKAIDEHLKWSCVERMFRSEEQNREILWKLKELKEAMASLRIPASTSQTPIGPTGTINSDEDYSLPHDVEEEEDRSQTQWLGKALSDFPAGPDDELNLTAEEIVQILGEEEEWFYVRKEQPGTHTKVTGWVPASFVGGIHSSFSVAATRDLQGDSLSHDVEEEDRTETQWLGKAICDFSARRDHELNLTVGEEVDILEKHKEWFYVSKKCPGRVGKVSGWVPWFPIKSHV